MEKKKVKFNKKLKKEDVKLLVNDFVLKEAALARIMKNIRDNNVSIFKIIVFIVQ